MLMLEIFLFGHLPFSSSRRPAPIVKVLGHDKTILGRRRGLYQPQAFLFCSAQKQVQRRGLALSRPGAIFHIQNLPRWCLSPSHPRGTVLGAVVRAYGCQDRVQRWSYRNRRSSTHMARGLLGRVVARQAYQAP